MINILKDKAYRRKIRRKISKKIWGFGLVWEEEIYSRMAGKYGLTPLKILTGDTIEISELTEFKFYGLFWYRYNQTDKTAGKIG